MQQASSAFDPSTATFYSYDNEQAISAKAKFIHANKLGGFMFWFMGADDAQNTLLSAIHRTL